MDKQDLEPLVEIITIGDELLIGQVIDTNSGWMAKRLNQEGFQVIHMTTVSDRAEAIWEAIDLAFKRVNIILVTGGLGPTKDDITKQTLCQYFGTSLVLNTAVLEHIKKTYAQRPQVLNELTIQQAYVPASATILFNDRGTAPGSWFEKEGKVLVSMPGVPYEMEGMMQTEVLPRLKKRFIPLAILHHTVLVHGYPESALAIKLSDWENQLPTEFKLAYLPSPGLIRLRLTGIGKDKKRLNALLQKELGKLRQLLGNALLAEEDIPLEVFAGNLLREKGLTLSTAESCTGGNIARLITSVPGSSTYFIGSVIAYSNDVKIKLLNVSPITLSTHGAVSQEVVEEMAEGLLQAIPADMAIAVSGIAGPDGGSTEKPVGTVWISVASHQHKISRCFQFTGSRDRNIQQASQSALILLKEHIDKEWA
jgi:nicotinamide-nucleotide amidase